jgi:hypothetical protein
MARISLLKMNKREYQIILKRRFEQDNIKKHKIYENIVFEFLYSPMISISNIFLIQYLLVTN